MATRSTLLRSAPYFPVTDVWRTVDYYKRVLGFKQEYTAGDPPEFAICSRDGHPIMFRRLPMPEKIIPNEKQGGTWDMFFWVDDVQSLHRELTASGATVVYGPILQESYQMMEFAVRDANGYVLGFGQKVDQ